MSADPTAEHIDAVARVFAEPPLALGSKSWRQANRLLTSTDPAVHAALAASLPAEVMLAALVERGTLTERWRCVTPEGEPCSAHNTPSRAMPPTGWTEERQYVTRWEVAP